MMVTSKSPLVVFNPFIVRFLRLLPVLNNYIYICNNPSNHSLWVSTCVRFCCLATIHMIVNKVTTLEPLNVDSLKKGHLLYSGHFVLFQRDIKVYP